MSVVYCLVNGLSKHGNNIISYKSGYFIRCVWFKATVHACKLLNTTQILGITLMFNTEM